MPRSFLAAIAMCFVAALCARAGTIVATIDAQGFTKGVPFQVIVQITGRDISNITVPEIDGASTKKQPNYSGTEIKYEQGVLTTTKSFGYVVTPERAGDINVPPFKAEIDGETVESKSLRITVLDSPKSLAGDQVLFTEIKTDKLEAYQGEAITLTMEVWILVGARVRYDPTGFPELTGFYALPRDPAKAEERMATRDGRQYKVVPFVQLLFPTSSGELRIGPWTWNCDIAFRGVARNREMKTDPFTIKVKPLPAPPDNFSGSVGKFQVAAGLSVSATDIGVPITLTVNISGNGNPDAIGVPHLPTINGVYVDEPRRIDHPMQGAGPAGEDFLYKLTPQRTGNIEIPPIDYVYFDPEQATYKTAQTNPEALQVRGTVKQEDQVIVGAGGAESITSSLGPDILDPATNAGSLSREGDLTIPAALGYSTPVAAYAALALFLRRRRRFATDRAFARAYSALKNGTELLAHARQSGRAADTLYRAITAYIADQFNLPETGMTSAEAQLFFSAHKVPAEIGEAFHKILKACERARYAAAELSADEIEALIQGAHTGMERLDEFLKRGRAA